MQFLVVAALVLSVAVASLISEDVDINEPLEREEIITAVNSANTTWKAGRNFPSYLKKSYLKNLLGVNKYNKEKVHLPILIEDGKDGIELPKNFDARQKWKSCTSLQEVRDQGQCGACWAVSAASAFTDRLCIASKTSFNGHLSAEELLTCSEQGGCEGGDPEAAWGFFKYNGIVTGGDYNSKEGCQPYTLKPCVPHYNCTPYLPTPPCKKVCYNKKYTKHPFTQDHHKVKSTFNIQLNNKLVQKELFNNGPLQTDFTVYEDFIHYKSGVYQHTSGAALGGHAVKIIGWGEENGTPYWLVANSWNKAWGDQGNFKILRGKDECGIEEDINGGTPDV